MNSTTEPDDAMERSLPEHASFWQSWMSRLLGPDAVGALGRGALTTLVVNVLAALIGLGMHVVLTWILNDEAQYGIYIVAVSTINFLALPLIGGGDTVLTRYLSEYSQLAKKSAMASLVSWTTRATWRRGWILVPLAIAALTAYYTLGLPSAWKDVGPITIVMIFATVPLLALSFLRQGTLKGLHQPAMSLVPESIVKPTFVVLLTVGMILAGASKTGTTTMVAFWVASLIALGVGTFLLPKSLRRSSLVPESRSSEALDSLDTSVWRQLAWSALTVAIAYTVLNRIDEWLLGILDSPGAAGLYGPASRYAGFVIFGLNAVNPMLGALIARHREDPVELQRLAKRSARIAAVISTPLAIVFMAAPWLPLSVLPEQYMGAACVLRILAAAQWINTLFGSVGMLLTMTGHHRDLAKILVVTAIANIVLNLLLIPPLGYLGAAIATATCIVGWNAVAWWLVKRRLGINASAV